MYQKFKQKRKYMKKKENINTSYQRRKKSWQKRNRRRDEIKARCGPKKEHKYLVEWTCNQVQTQDFLFLLRALVLTRPLFIYFCYFLSNSTSLSAYPTFLPSSFSFLFFFFLGNYLASFHSFLISSLLIFWVFCLVAQKTL